MNHEQFAAHIIGSGGYSYWNASISTWDGWRVVGDGTSAGALHGQGGVTRYPDMEERIEQPNIEALVADLSAIARSGGLVEQQDHGICSIWEWEGEASGWKFVQSDFSSSEI